MLEREKTLYRACCCWFFLSFSKPYLTLKVDWSSKSLGEGRLNM
jgi:hypothetical protein